MLNKIRTSAKLTFLVIVLCSFILVIGIYGIHELKIMNQNTKTLYQDRVLPLSQLTTVRYSYATEILATAHQLDNGQVTFSQALQKIQEADKNISTNWNAYKLTFFTSDEKLLSNQNDQLISSGGAVINQLINVLKLNDKVAVHNLVSKELDPAINPIVNKLNELVQLQVRVSHNLYNNNNAAYNATAKGFYIAIIASILFALGLSFLIVNDNRRLFNSLEISNRQIASSEEKLRAFVDNAGDAILILDLDFHIIEVNKYASIMTGYSKDELMGMKLADLMPSHEREDHLFRKEIIKNKGTSLHERKIIRKDGNVIETEVNVTSLKGTGYVNIIRNVADVREAQRQIALSESTLRSAFDHSATGMALVSLEGEFLKANIALCNITGYTCDELLTMNFTDVTHPDDQNEDLDFVAQALKGEIENFSLEKRYIRKDKSVILIKLNSSLVRDVSGKPLFFVSQIEDITQAKQLASELAEKEFQYTSLFNNASEYIAVFDNNGFVIDVNDSLCKLTGLKKEELLKMRAEDIIEPENLKNTPIDYEVKPVGHKMITDRKIKKASGGFADVEVSRKQIDANRIMSIGRDVSERNLIAQQLKESELKFRGLVEKSMVGVYIIQGEKFAYVNPRLSEIFGYRPNELINTFKTTKLVDADSVELVTKSINDKIVGEVESTHYEAEGIKKDGQKIWMEVYSTATFFQGKKAVIGSILDITDRKKAEARIIEQAEVFKAIIENTKESIYLISPDYKVLQFNSTARERERITRGMEIYIGADFRDFVYPDKKEIFNSQFEDALKGIYRKEEVRAKDITGGYIWFQSKTSPVYDPSGNLIGVRVLTDDINDRKIAESVLRESEEKFRSIVEQSLVGIYIIQRQKLIYVNPGFEKIFGYSKDKLVNQTSFEDFVHPDDLELVKNNYDQRAIIPTINQQYIIKAIKSDNSILHLEVIASVISYNNEAAIIGTLVDITGRIEEERRMNQAVLDAQEKERLQIGMELHDNVKQILAGSGLYMDMAIKKIDDKPAVTSILTDLRKFNTEAIVELRRLSHQLAPLVELHTDLGEKIAWLIRSLKIDEKLSVSIHVDEFKEPINNKTQLTFYRILQEQLNNIQKYAKASAIEINVWSLEKDIHLQIMDNGKGFNINAKKDGIGLENIRRRTQMLNGTLEIISSPGNGCEVNVVVPFIPEPHQS